MVHSSSASPMKTTPLASPHLTVATTALPLQATSSESPPADIGERDQTLISDTFPSQGVPSNSELTLACSLSPTNAEPTVVSLAKVYATVDAEPPFVAVAKPLDTNLTPVSPAVTPTPDQGLLNGRTSSRKRTPKACDCCGPNSKAHNARTAGRGRGRGRGRRKTDQREDFNTPRWNMHGQTDHIKCLDLPKETVKETECQGYTNENVQTAKRTLVGDGTERNEEDKDTMPAEGPLVVGAGEQKGGDDLMSSGLTNWGATSPTDWGRGKVGVTPVSNMEGGRRGDLGGDMKNCKTNVLPQAAFVQTHGINSDADMDHEASDWSSDKSLENGDTVNLSDTEPEEEARGSAVTGSAMENGLHPYLGPSVSAQDVDSEMQVDLRPDEISSPSSVSVFNGSSLTQTNEGHPETCMEVQSSQPDEAAPLTISVLEHLWALRDHRLYCLPGTWEKDLEQVSGQDGSHTALEEESREQLTDMIHGEDTVFYYSHECILLYLVLN